MDRMKVHVQMNRSTQRSNDEKLRSAVCKGKGRTIRTSDARVQRAMDEPCWSQVRRRGRADLLRLPSEEEVAAGGAGVGC